MATITTTAEWCGLCGADLMDGTDVARGLCSDCRYAEFEATGEDAPTAADRAWWASENEGGSTAEADADFVAMMTLSPREYRELAEAIEASLSRSSGRSFE